MDVFITNRGNIQIRTGMCRKVTCAMVTYYGKVVYWDRRKISKTSVESYAKEYLPRGVEINWGNYK